MRLRTRTYRISLAACRDFGSESEQAAARRQVVFFGTPFLLVRNLTPEQYVEVLNRCLDYLRAHYGERCRLVYRPHPAETQEQERLQLQGFEIENDREVAELYFVKNFPGDRSRVFRVFDRLTGRAELRA